MGQLERYGLYVLCLVIFLILGVAIWGSDPRELRQHNLVSNEVVKVKTQDDHRKDVRAFAEERVRTSIAKHEAAEDAMFQKAKRPPHPVVDTSGQQPRVEIPKAVEPKHVPEEVVTEHIVAEGDNFSSLAKSYLNNANLYYRIVAANPDLDPKQLKIGARVVIPKRVVRTKKGSVGASGDTHKVRDGESPWRIAEKYVSPRKVPAYTQRIIKLNGISDSKRLSAGTVIKLPSR